MRQIAKSLARPLGPVLLALLLQQPWAFYGARAQEQASTAASKTSRLSPALPVSLEQALYLIRSTLLTLNDANRSGNYTVLHDLAAPDFQAQNSAADLGQSFSDLRHRNFDLYGVALLAPQFTEAPALDQNGLLRLAGYFPTPPAADQVRPGLPGRVRAMAATCHIGRHAGSPAGGGGAAASPAEA